MIKCYCKSLIVLMALFAPVFAQNNNTAPLVNDPPVSTLIGVLTSSLESKSATAGQEFTLKTISDVMVGGQLVIPRGSRVLGHVTEAVTKGKDQSQSELSLVIEKAVRPNGSEVPLQGIIAALAAPPQSNSLSDDPTYGMLHSNEPTQRISGSSAVGSGGGSSTTLPAASKAGSTAAVATANLKGAMDKSSVLDENSQGAIGYEDFSIAWHLITPPPITVISSKGKNVKLKPGTQMLLRMTPPRTQ